MTTLSRRRSRRDDEPVEDEPTTDEDRPRRRRRGRDEDESSSDDRPRRRRNDDEDDKPSRRRRGKDEDEDRRSRPRRGEGGRASSGFASYKQKKAATSNYATEFKPDENEPTLIKFLDAEPFDSFIQHWIDDVPKGDPKSYMCHDDEFFDDREDGCPLCEIGEPGKTYSMFNIIDLANPRKPEVKVWVTSPAITDKLERAADNDRTSPLNREDVYFEVEKVKKSRKTEWTIAPVKARDLDEDFDMEPLGADEIEEFEKDAYVSRKGVVRVDSYDDLEDLAKSLED